MSIDGFQVTVNNVTLNGEHIGQLTQKKGQWYHSLQYHWRGFANIHEAYVDLIEQHHYQDQEYWVVSNVKKQAQHV